MTLVTHVALCALPRLVDQLGRDGVGVLVGELALDLGLYERQQPLQDAFAKPPLMQVAAVDLVDVEIITELLLEPAHGVTADVSFLADGASDNFLPVVVLGTEVDTHLRVAKPARQAVKVITKGQFVHDGL